MPEFIKKPEKLASALYLITSFFNDQEPIKWKLRSLGSELVSLSAPIKDNLFKEQEAVALKIRNLVSEITGLLAVARNAGLVSSANHDLMQAELGKYVATLDYPKNVADLLNLETPKSDRLESPDFKEVTVIKDKIKYEALEIENRPRSESNPKNSLKEFGAISVKKNSRQSVIIAILKRKKEITIKDVSPLINGCSEKTIQRELSAMVRSGTLKKVGEKRWSRYSLV